MSEVAAGTLWIDTTGNGEVVINHPDLKPDENGVGHIVFSPEQERQLGELMLAKAEAAHWENVAATQLDGLPVLEYGKPRHQGPPPQHAFEVTIKIGGNDWDYVLRTMRELATHLEDCGPACSSASGGWDGCHSVNVAQHDVTPEQYRNELMVWDGRG